MTLKLTEKDYKNMTINNKIKIDSATNTFFYKGIKIKLKKIGSLFDSNNNNYKILFYNCRTETEFKSTLYTSDCIELKDFHTIEIISLLKDKIDLLYYTNESQIDSCYATLKNKKKQKENSFVQNRKEYFDIYNMALKTNFKGWQKDVKKALIKRCEELQIIKI